MRKKNSWLILGARGQLGHAVVDSLASHGEVFETLDREALDLADFSKVNRIFSQLKPSVIVNAAAWTNVDAAEKEIESVIRINGTAPGIIASAANSIGAQLIHISTDYVFSEPATKPWSEYALTCPASVYGKSKALGEREVYKFAPDNSRIIRTAWLYSPWGRNFVKTMIQLARRDEAFISVVNDQFGQPTSAADVASQIYLLVEANVAPGIYHATNSGQATWFDFAQEIFAGIGADPGRVRPIASHDYPQAAKRPPYSVLGHDRWKEQGLEPLRDWRVALREALPVISSAMNTAQ